MEFSTGLETAYPKHHIVESSLLFHMIVVACPVHACLLSLREKNKLISELSV
jgi:hypothetical protein